MTSSQAGARTEEVARVRGYITSQAAKLSPADVVEKVEASQAAVLEAAARVPAGKLETAPANGEWSASEVLYHVLTVVGDSSRAIISTIKTGVPTRVRPDRLEHLSPKVTLEEARRLLEAERAELYQVVKGADPSARLDVQVFKHPEFGAFNWRESLLFVRVHDMDHSRQLGQIADALGAAS